MGFTFDDSDSKGVASKVAEMERLISKDPKNGERIFPYLSGEEVNSSPVQAHSRFVINFEDLPLERSQLGDSWFQLPDGARREQLRLGIVAPDYPGAVAADWPDLLKIVRERVKPIRDLDNREVRRREWWKFAEKTPGLIRSIEHCRRFISCALYSPHLSFVFLPRNIVIANKLCAIPFENFAPFTTLQSRVNEGWARFFSSTLKDDLAYAPSDCFETFPFPAEYDSSPLLEEIGAAYYHLRADLMIRNNEGLTKTYNRFHDPNEDSPDVVRLRELHAAMDRAVLDAYGWQDIQPVCEFIPEFDDEEDEDDNGRPKKKKYRYKWPEAIHDEVLARLLELNRERAEEERREAELEPSSWENGAIEPTSKPKRVRGKNGAKSDTIAEKPTLFNAEEQEV